MATVPRGLVQNAAVSVGRVSMRTPETISVHADVFLSGWCAALRGLTDGDEKRDAFRGLICVVRANPHVVHTHFKSICECFASWRTVDDPELVESMGYVVRVGVEAGVELGAIDPGVRHKLGLSI